ncbi:hypothetical protein AAJV73_11395 [Cyanobium sp. BSA11S]|uniref:hypothetical protein n=1 Tax=Cyanobium sp. BSA11S TaxID=3108224 RepID=UPI003D819805
MDAAGPYLAVTYARTKIQFFEFKKDDGDVTVLASFDPPRLGKMESVGLAYHPTRQRYYLISDTQLYTGTPGGTWTRIGEVGRTRGYNESQPMVYVGDDSQGNARFAVFALGPKENMKPYEFSFSLFTVDPTDRRITMVSGEEYVELSDQSKGSAGGAPSFRWGGNVTFDGTKLTLFAVPKRLDASGNYYYWESPSSKSQTYEVRIDCKYSGLSNTETKNRITVQFWSSTDRVNSIYKNGISDCSSDAVFRISSPYNITRVVVKTDGRDAFFIDDLRILRNGDQVRRYSNDEGRAGWCISKDKTDNTRTWKGKANKCQERTRFPL